MHKIYCYGREHPCGYLAESLGDDGHGLAQHCCSHVGYARRDLGMDGSTWKHEQYDKHFGPGNWELEWVNDVKTHAGWQAALKLNQALHVEVAE